MSRKTEDSMESKLDEIRAKFRETFDPGWETELHVVWTFPDAVIIGDWSDKSALYEIPYTELDDEIVFGEPKEVEQVIVLKRLLDAGIKKQDLEEAVKAMVGKNSESTDTELTGPIVFKNAPQKIAYAAVLVPGELDYDGEAVTAEKIEQSAHEWMEGYGNVDLMHTLNNVAVPVESFILPMEWEVSAYGKKMILPQGTWILASKVQDDEVWKKVEKGEYTGYSVMGIRRAALKDLVGKAKDGALKDFDSSLKKTLLRDLGPDWVAAFVSIVDEPAVPKAKFFALKSKEDSNNETGKGGLFEKVLKSIGALKEGRRFSDTTYNSIKKAVDALSALLKEAEKERKEKGSKNKSSEEVDIEMDKKELQEVVNEAVKAVVTPLQEEISEIKKSIKAAKPEEKKDKDDTAGKGKDDDDDEDDDDDAGEETAGKGKDDGKDKGDDSFKADVLKRLDEIDKKFKKSGSASKALTGQDGEEGSSSAGEEEDDRDLYGRKRKGAK